MEVSLRIIFINFLTVCVFHLLTFPLQLISEAPESEYEREMLHIFLALCTQQQSFPIIFNGQRRETSTLDAAGQENSNLTGRLLGFRKLRPIRGAIKEDSIKIVPNDFIKLDAPAAQVLRWLKIKMHHSQLKVFPTHQLYFISFRNTYSKKGFLNYHFP